MTGRLTAWWQLRSLRERKMLLALGALVAAMLLWFALIAPVVGLLEAARQRHADALVAEGEARARIARLNALRRAARLSLPAPLGTVVRRTTSEAGFAAVQIGSETSRSVAVTIPAARPQAVFAWLEGLRGQGIVPQSLSLRSTPGGQTVSVEATLSTAGRGG